VPSLPGVTDYPCKIGGGDRSAEDCLLAKCSSLLVRLGDDSLKLISQIINNTKMTKHKLEHLYVIYLYKILPLILWKQFNFAFS